MATSIMDPCELLTRGLRHLSNGKYGEIPLTTNEPIQNLVKPHIGSFNWCMQEGLSTAAQSIQPVEFALPNGDRISLAYLDASVMAPRLNHGILYRVKTLKVYPAECRERGTTYDGKLQAKLRVSIAGKTEMLDKHLGDIPIMVKSELCNLHDLTPSELVSHHEEATEAGGYFIINGLEKVIRMMVMPRRNYVIAMKRASWMARGKNYTEYGVTMRCVRDDQTTTNIVLHYLTTGLCVLCFTYRREQFFVPLMMIVRCLADFTDERLYSEFIKGKEDDTFYTGSVIAMLRELQSEGILTRSLVLQYLGRRFRDKLGLTTWYTDEEVGRYLMRECICVHLGYDLDKFNILVYMTKKLFSVARGESMAESADAIQNQEVLLPGHLYLMILKEKMEIYLQTMKYMVLRKAERDGKSLRISAVEILSMAQQRDITKAMSNFLATGNVVTKQGLGLMQYAGFSVMADKLNYFRYMSHFRSIHRGAFFAAMRTTAVRRLLPETFGFICPVHTPDGAPCGLLNHLAAFASVAPSPAPIAGVAPLLISELGMIPYDATPGVPFNLCLTVILNGRLVGWVPISEAANFTKSLRRLKLTAGTKIHPSTEIVHLPKSIRGCQYPGIFIYMNAARFMRRVYNLDHEEEELIGSMEQLHQEIAISKDDIKQCTTHVELCKDSMLSMLGRMTPFSEFNQGPRNIYQCQMAKQTMGTPLHAWQHRADNKLYRIQTPQSPLCRPAAFDDYNLDDYPLGTNAVIAVISYTGYDMEDAMIISKSAMERGFGHGYIYKTERVKLNEAKGGSLSGHSVFGQDKDRYVEELDSDGLPFIGTKFTEGTPFYSYINLLTGQSKVVLFKSQEDAFLDHIKICGSDDNSEGISHACFFLRVQRNPMIGDKFASRHGQKGVCSQLWPVENMPFTESGMTPDIIFNPHGFPSRMTIGMMIELMANKSAAINGCCHDATPFVFSEEDPAIDYFGRLLREANYDYYGTERMYSGVSGLELEADIFFGPIYYQRLRHMVSDKFQVRSTGPIDELTHQPLKGRKRMGGIRFGEMERDSLLSHGTPFLLKDRLFDCSDFYQCHVCRSCGSILSPVPMATGDQWECCTCHSSTDIGVVDLPYVFRYMTAELASMNIKTIVNAGDV